VNEIADHELTEEQKEIVDPRELTDTYVEACPGAGKTRTIVARFIASAARLPPNRGIAILSFTNAAATEVRKRCRVGGIRDLCSFPHFVGTFDAFINRYLVLPFGSPWCLGHPTILESWSRIEVDIRAGERGASVPFGIPLDDFPVGDDLEITLPVEPPQNVRRLVQADGDAWLKAAKRRRKQLLAAGLLTCADARAVGLSRVRDASLGSLLASTLSSRFSEVVIDEAQDCDQQELQLIDWLRSSGIRLVLVCDPDQAIFAFRGGDREGLRVLSAKLTPRALTGNFRSTQPICAVAATLRSRPPDRARGRNAAFEQPPVLISYDGKLSSAVGAAFLSALKRNEQSNGDIVVLAHKRRHAFAAAGKAYDASISDARTVRLASAVIGFHHGDPRERLRAVEFAQNLLLGRLRPDFDDHDTAERQAERTGLSPRWLRTAACALLASLPLPTADAEDWLERARHALHQIAPPPGSKWSRSSKQTLAAPKKWPIHVPGSECSCQPLTIHAAKGLEYDGVLVVIPPHSQHDDTKSLVQSWASGSDLEAKCVLYVGVTRAARYLGIAVPSKTLETLRPVLGSNGLVWNEIHVS
jgi:DNA helicase II / ATP-dependent DNA helicase PcrA